MAGGDGKDKKGVEVQSEFKFATKERNKNNNICLKKILYMYIALLASKL